VTETTLTDIANQKSISNPDCTIWDHAS